jgi:nicotinate-nucleotide pyrophosphorylase (carboxylating)
MSPSVSALIDLALAEDIGSGDVTASFFIDPADQAHARIVARQEGCLAGLETAITVLRRVDSELDVQAHATDGDDLAPGGTILEVRGSAASILTAERTALNFLQHLSGVATAARQYVQAIEGTSAKLLDTRKTTPGFRELEKAAVHAAGATNHRHGLYDMVMIKDNHLATGLTPEILGARVAAARAARPDLRIEIEADTLEQALLFFQIPGIDLVLLDNMPPDTLREAVRRCPAGVQLEASGGITLETIRPIAETGVHWISVGAVTHSAPALDVGLDFIPQSKGAV